MAETTRSEFVERIGKGLERVYQDTLEHSTPIDIKTAKIIIFSDHHRGLRNGADDFRLSEPAYHAALAYYFNMGHTLVLLGDSEELWEEHPEPVVKVNAHSFELERKFHEVEGQRYYRILGNHDDEWHNEERMKQLIQPHYGPTPLLVLDGLHLHVRDGDQELGRFFLTHGHQGTKDSDFQLDSGGNKMAVFSKWAVHYLLRNFQRITKIPTNTPARDFKLSDRHDLAMYTWATAQKDTILITGHTHKPVFASQDYLARLNKELTEITNELLLSPQAPSLLKKLSETAAKIEWTKAKEPKPEGRSSLGKTPKPCYFNSGCCSFSDGDVTGIEIVDGMIRLVRWPDDSGNPLPKTLDERDLLEIFTELKATS